jgi:uncharacterized protein
MGLDDNNFDTFVIEIIQRHSVEELNTHAVSLRRSSTGKYLAVTVTIHAHSQAQLDAIYHELSTHKRVLMVL